MPSIGHTSGITMSSKVRLKSNPFSSALLRAPLQSCHIGLLVLENPPCGALKHPQLFVSPHNKAAPMIDFSTPQSQRHSQCIALLRTPTGRRAVRFPNRWFLRFLEPHPVLFPLSNPEASTTRSKPQSQRQ